MSEVTTAIALNTYESPFGILKIEISLKGLYKIEFTDTKFDQVGETTLWESCEKQLDEYFTGKRSRFDLPIDLHGTPFQLSVWKTALDIPVGQTWTYQDVAEVIGRPKAVRAVGQALNRNPVCVVVPCHRVISSTGEMGGYAYGEPIKQSLLRMEKVLFGNSKNPRRTVQA